MKSNFEASLRLVLKHEGGYVDHPKDPGGATYRGVTTRVYDRYRNDRGLPSRSVRLMTEDEMIDIYKAGYWDVCRCDLLPIGLDYAVFDYAVNSGPARARKDASDLPGGTVMQITELCARRLAYMKSLSTWSTFGLGWRRRVEGYVPGQQDDDIGVVDYAIVMAKAAEKAAVAIIESPVAPPPNVTEAIVDKVAEVVADLPQPVDRNDTPLAAGPKAQPNLLQRILDAIKGLFK